MNDVTSQDIGDRSTDDQSTDAEHLIGEGGLALRSRTGGSVAFGVRDLGGRRVLAVEIAGEDSNEYKWKLAEANQGEYGVHVPTAAGEEWVTKTYRLDGLQLAARRRLGAQRLDEELREDIERASEMSLQHLEVVRRGLH